MGRFVNWMMQKEDDWDDRYSSEYGNNFDRLVSNRNLEKYPVQEQPERSPSSYEKREEIRADRHEKKDAVEFKTLPLVNDRNASQNVVVYSPRTYEDVQTLIDYLKRREPAVVNLAGINPDSAQRILDFMSGAIYGLSGSIHKISGSIFLLTPEGVSIMVPVDIKDNLERR